MYPFHYMTEIRNIPSLKSHIPQIVINWFEWKNIDKTNHLSCTTNHFNGKFPSMFSLSLQTLAIILPILRVYGNISKQFSKNKIREKNVMARKRLKPIKRKMYCVNDINMLISIVNVPPFMSIIHNLSQIYIYFEVLWMLRIYKWIFKFNFIGYEMKWMWLRVKNLWGWLLIRKQQFLFTLLLLWFAYTFGKIENPVQVSSIYCIISHFWQATNLQPHNTATYHPIILSKKVGQLQNKKIHIWDDKIYEIKVTTMQSSMAV